MDLKERYEANLKYLEEYEKIEGILKKVEEDYKKKVEALRRKQRKLENENCYNVYDEEYDSYSKISKFYFELEKEDFLFEPYISLSSESVDKNISTYEYFKSKIEKYKNMDYLLIKVVTPKRKIWLDRDGEEEIWTIVNELLIPSKILGKLTGKIKNISEKQYNNILKLEGVYKLKENSLYGKKTPSIEILDETQVNFSLTISNFYNKDKNLLKNPLNPNYDKNLEQILFETLSYSINIKKLKKSLIEKKEINKSLNNLEAVK